ncbi:hypothetical protein MJO29_008297 [Puccinia striiformis f. sp. tritici]|nr:hypothetical protein MJO29_008297 [Puccinia striiformis f. sp. tritici]
MPKIENIFTFHPTDLALVVDDDAASVVAQDVDLVGEVTIGPNCIVHPSCTIVALGPIIFGSGCIIEEQSVICNRSVLHYQSTTTIPSSSSYNNANRSQTLWSGRWTCFLFFL